MKYSTDKDTKEEKRVSNFYKSKKNSKWFYVQKAQKKKRKK
jgi:hypothetical protein